MPRPLFPLLGLLALSFPANAVAPPDATQSAIRRGLDRLQQGATRYIHKRDCFSCHHQALTVAVFQEAKRHAMPIDHAFLKDQIAFTLDTFRPKIDRIRKGQAVPGGNTMAAYALFTLQHGEHPVDTTTGALVEFLLARQKADGSWPAVMPRPPSEGSSFTNTALALQALPHFGREPALRKRAEAAATRGKAWLLAHKPVTMEDRAFHLRGLVTASADKETLAKARQSLLRDQGEDGTWAQLPRQAGDAYATATVLLALRKAGLNRADAAYRKGLRNLLHTQQADGSWIVTTRSKPVQTFFDNGDPGGKSQFISFLATGWATWALLDSLPLP